MAEHSRTRLESAPHASPGDRGVCSNTPRSADRVGTIPRAPRWGAVGGAAPPHNRHFRDGSSNKKQSSAGFPGLRAAAHKARLKSYHHSTWSGAYENSDGSRSKTMAPPPVTAFPVVSTAADLRQGADAGHREQGRGVCTSKVHKTLTGSIQATCNVLNQSLQDSLNRKFILFIPKLVNIQWSLGFRRRT